MAFPSDTLFGRAVVQTGNNYRLGRLLAKFRARRLARIGFIGGSITEGAMASAYAYRYSTRFCGFLRKAFPLTDIVELNAGIGATDSRFGCSRLKDDLLDAKPDMIVIEFAVNDDLADTAGSAAAIEGLIRQALQDPDVPVLLFQTMNRRGDSLNQAVQARIARHYALPVISYLNACRPLIEAGTLPWTELSQDDVHPNDKGHLIGGYLLYEYLKREASALELRPDGPLPIPPFLGSDLYQLAGIFGSGTTVLEIRENQGWDASLDGKRRYRFQSHAKGDRLILRTRAKETTALFQSSKDLDSRVRVSLDGSIVDTLSSHYTEEWGTGYLKPRLLFKSQEGKERSLEFVNLTGGDFDLRYTLYAE